MEEAEVEDIRDFKCFNEFFTRTLKAVVRPIDRRAVSIVSPADGVISQVGDTVDNQIIQAKGKYYNLSSLLGGDDERALPFKNGKFATIYLSPKDYHRLHMPLDGNLKEMVYIPGRLFSVNEATTAFVEKLFGRNERVVAVFNTRAGPMALVLVGALFVASIETVWQGIITPPKRSAPQSWNYKDKPIELKKGEEMGRFNMGSTLIVLFGGGSLQWSDAMRVGQPLKIGQSIGILSG